MFRLQVVCCWSRVNIFADWLFVISLLAHVYDKNETGPNHQPHLLYICSTFFLLLLMLVDQGLWREKHFYIINHTVAVCVSCRMKKSAYFKIELLSRWIKKSIQYHSGDGNVPYLYNIYMRECVLVRLDSVQIVLYK